MTDIVYLAGTNVNKIYLDNIRGIMANVSNGGTVAIEIVPEPNNPFDPKALRVDFNGSVVGYIPKASQYLFTTPKIPQIEKWGLTEKENAYCYLRLTG